MVAVAGLMATDREHRLGLGVEPGTSCRVHRLDPRAVAGRVRRALPSARRVRPTDQLDGLSIPVRLLAATNDPLSPLQNNRELAEMLSAGTLVDLGHGAHEVTLEQPDRVVAEIVRLAESL